MVIRNLTVGRPAPAAIGIDFGTSKCCVAAVRGGRVHVLENEFGQRTTPSCVAFTSQQRLVGGAALDQAVVNCANTVHAVKRTLGRTYDQVKAIPSACKIDRDDSSSDTILYCVNYRKRQLLLSPEQITAMLLTKMKDIAESSLGCPVKRAVISVPASFGNAQRAALLTASRVAGLEVLQLINETTAAGVAFEDNRTVKTAVTIAVVDFGAGKLDVSLMEVKEGSVRVIAAAGSPYLGGCDLDEVLVEHCGNVMRQKYGNELKIDDKAHAKLRLACEKVKKNLTLLPKDQLNLPFLVKNIDENVTVSRKEFYGLFINQIHRKIVSTFERLFKQKSMKKDIIDKVVLVGGSTRIPAVKFILEEYFGAHKLDQTVNQDEAVAQGAALRAAALTKAVAGVQVADVLSYDIYCGTDVDNVDRLIPKFTSLPSTTSHWFREKNGSKLCFFERIYGVSERRCDTLGSVLFKESKFRDAYVIAELGVQFSQNGLFSFSNYSQIDLSVEPMQLYPSYVISHWLKKEKQFRREEDSEDKRVDAKVELESLCSELQGAFSNPELAEHCRSRELDTWRKSVSNTLDWMTTHIKHASMGDICTRITKLNSAKICAKHLQDSARRKKKALAVKEEAARKQAETENIADKISDFKSQLSEIICASNDSDLVKYSNSREIESCKALLSSLMTWAENSESVSDAQVVQKFEELNAVKEKVDQLKADAVREKALLEKKAARNLTKMKMIADQISASKFLLFELNCILDDSNLQRNSDSQRFNSCKSILSSCMTWVENMESASAIQVSQKLEELNQVAKEVDQLKADAARVEALVEQEVARQQAEMEMLASQVSAFKSLLSEVNCALEDSSLVMYSDCQKLESCKVALLPLETWAENIRSASPTQVTRKLEELTRLKDEVDQLKAEAARVKSLVEEKAAIKLAEIEMIASQVSAFKSLLSEVNCALEDSSLVMYSERQKLESCKAALLPLETWAENIRSASPTQVSRKLEELTRLKDEVYQLKADAARVKSLVEEKAAVKLAEMEMLKEKMVTFECFLSEVNFALNDSDLQRYSDFQKFRSCMELMSSAVTWKENVSVWKSTSLSQVSQKLEELTRLRNEVDQLKADAAHAKALMENKVAETTRVRSTLELPSCLEYANPGDKIDCNTRNVTLNSITKMNKGSRNEFQHTTIFQNSHLSQGTQTGTTAAQASTQTNLVPENCSTCKNMTSVSDEAKSLSDEEKLLVKNFENSDILLPWLEVMKAYSNGIANCEHCAQFRCICCKHRSEAYEEFGKFMNSLPKIVMKYSQIDRENYASPRSAKEIGGINKSTTSHVSDTWNMEHKVTLLVQLKNPLTSHTKAIQHQTVMPQPPDHLPNT